MTHPDVSRKSDRATDAAGEPVTLGEHNGFEIYPMPMFATLAVADVAGVAAWYERALGFGVVFRAPAAEGQQPALVHLRRRKYQDVLLVPARADAPAPASLTITFSADGELDALTARAGEAPAFGVSAVSGPVDTPWNTRDLRVTDPAGHRLVFTSRQPNPDPERSARLAAMFGAETRSRKK
jgi:uncharacterized glyoxalase superfamily protein PhnB